MVRKSLSKESMVMASVYVLMGSANDKGKLLESGFVEILDEVLGKSEVEYAVCSAHRNAEVLAEYVPEAISNGARLFVCMAGLAAALPGAVAANSLMKVPVIGIPLDEHGIDSCIYMPPGAPIMTTGVGKDGLKNAALAACQIMAAGRDIEVSDRWAAFLSNERSKKPAQLGINPRA